MAWPSLKLRVPTRGGGKVRVVARLQGAHNIAEETSWGVSAPTTPRLSAVSLCSGLKGGHTTGTPCPEPSDSMWLRAPSIPLTTYAILIAGIMKAAFSKQRSCYLLQPLSLTVVV